MTQPDERINTVTIIRFVCLHFDHNPLELLELEFRIGIFFSGEKEEEEEKGNDKFSECRRSSIDCSRSCCARVIEPLFSSRE